MMQEAVEDRCGGRGIGREMAKEFAARGANIALFDLNQADLDAASAECRAAGVQARGYLANVTQEATVIAAMDAVVADFGGIDVLVNNAGIVKDGLLIKVKDYARRKQLDKSAQKMVPP